MLLSSCKTWKKRGPVASGFEGSIHLLVWVCLTRLKRLGDGTATSQAVWSRVKVFGELVDICRYLQPMLQGSLYYQPQTRGNPSTLPIYLHQVWAPQQWVPFTVMAPVFTSCGFMISSGYPCNLHPWKMVWFLLIKRKNNSKNIPLQVRKNSQKMCSEI